MSDSEAVWVVIATSISMAGLGGIGGYALAMARHHLFLADGFRHIYDVEQRTGHEAEFDDWMDAFGSRR